MIHDQAPRMPLWPWVVSGLSVIALVIALVWSGTQTHDLAHESLQLSQQGVQAHVAFCTLKKDYTKRLSDNKLFLSMTVEQRVKKYGPALGHIPDSVIQQSVHALQANLTSLKILECSP